MTISFKEWNIEPILSHVGIHRRHLSQAPLLLEEASMDLDEANRFMRMFYLFQGTQQEAFSLELQKKALSIRQIFKINLNNEQEGLRVLAVMAPGDMMQNLPLDYLLERQGIELTLMFLLPNEALPDQYPEHDVTVFALGQSSANAPIIEKLIALMPHWPKPYVNHPKYIECCARDKTFELLGGIKGLLMAQQSRQKKSKMVGVAFPCTIRPVDSHAGEKFEKLWDQNSLDDYLSRSDDEEFYVSTYLDYQSPDGMFRKFRVALIQGVPYVSHLAISSNWVVSYLSAEMYKSQDKRREEAQFMRDFRIQIAQTFKDQFEAVYRKIPFDYLVLDCAVSKSGQLIVFEVDNSAWVHNTDAQELFPYKNEHMVKLMADFSKMLHSKTVSTD